MTALLPSTCAGCTCIGQAVKKDEREMRSLSVDMWVLEEVLSLYACLASYRASRLLLRASICPSIPPISLDLWSRGIHNESSARGNQEKRNLSKRKMEVRGVGITVLVC